MPVNQTPFYMIRHGETEANLARRMAGSVDSPLTQLGRDQADQARRIIEQLDHKPDFIVHSHLSRARDTAHIINQNLGLPMTEDPDYAEWHAGDWENQPYDTCNDMMRGWVDPPNGESKSQFETRIKRAKNKALKDNKKTPLIVCHGGVFRIFAKLYELEIWGVRNCHLHHFSPQEPSHPPPQDGFPWDAHCYEHDGESLTRRRSEFFFDPDNAAK